MSAQEPQNPREAASVAATWWTEAITSPQFRNGDSSALTTPATASAYRQAERHKPSGEQLEAFRAHLIEWIIAELTPDQIQTKSELMGRWERGEDGRKHLVASWIEEVEVVPSCSLGVDYRPYGQLAESAQHCGIHDSVFPWKTVMSVTASEVRVKAGYGEEPSLIWSAVY